MQDDFGYPHLCTLIEEPPEPGTHSVIWPCPRCRIAWTAAVLSGRSPLDPHHHLLRARDAAEAYNEPHLARAADELERRLLTGAE